MPGFQRFIVPFYDCSDPTITNATDKYRGKANCRVIETAQLGPHALAFMHASETLLVHGHGNYGLRTLSNRDRNATEVRTMTEIGAWLRALSLPAGHIRIKLLGCETQPAAQDLARDLGPDFPNVVVGGYTKSIYIGAGNRSMFVRDGEQWARPNTTNSGVVWWYDATGRSVAKPRPQDPPQMLYDPYLDTH